MNVKAQELMEDLQRIKPESRRMARVAMVKIWAVRITPEPENTGPGFASRGRRDLVSAICTSRLRLLHAEQIYVPVRGTHALEAGSDRAKPAQGFRLFDQSPARMAEAGRPGFRGNEETIITQIQMTDVTPKE